MNNQETYKHVKINWLAYIVMIVLTAVTYVHMIFAYIHKWGNNPVSKNSFVAMGICLALAYTYVIFGAGRFIIKIDDNFVIVRSDLHKMFKIKLVNIKNVDIEWLDRAWLGGVCFPEGVRYPKKNIERIHIYYVKQVVSIKVKSGKIYQLATQNAQEIKEEIEKRMLITNNIPSIA